MESEIAEMLLLAALGSASPYALTAAAEWLRRLATTHRNGSDAPSR